MAPQTPAELAGMVGGPLGNLAAVGGAALAPETFGASLLPAALLKYGIPMAAAGITGAYEAPPGQRWERSKQEMEKEAAGLALAKPLEYLAGLPARALGGEQGMLARSAGRIMRGVKDLFGEYPAELDTPNTMEGIRRDVASGKLKDRVGARLGAFRKELEDKIPEYKPGAPVKSPTLYGPGPSTASGEPFTVFTPDANGDMVPKQVSVGDAIDHTQKMNGMGYTGGGSDTGGPLSWAYRKAGHDSRQSIYTTLNQIGAKYGLPESGTLYRQASGDAGAAEILTDAFTNAQRSLGREGAAVPVIDQPALNKRISKELSHLRLLRPESADAFSAAVAPGGASAIPEGGGRWGLRRFTPESRAMYDPITRAATSPYVTRAFAPQLGRIVPGAPLTGLAMQHLAEHGLPGLRLLGGDEGP